MKKAFTTTLFLLLTIGLFAQHGILKESLKMKSTTLGHDVEYSVYLPFDYETSNRSYPVLYLLHGFGGDETGWLQYGNSSHITDQAIANGDAPPMIIVMPDAGISWYINSADGKERYEDFFINEFIPNIERGFRIRSKKEFRAVAGLSMGGHGSLIMATKHPEMFAACVPLSAGVWTEDRAVELDEKSWDHYFAQAYGTGLKGTDRLNGHYRQNSVMDIIENADADELKKVRFYIDCGDDDFLIKGNMALHSLLIDKKIPHEFRVRDGAHNWHYWRTALPEVLRFVGESFWR